MLCRIINSPKITPAMAKIRKSNSTRPSSNGDTVITRSVWTHCIERYNFPMHHFTSDNWTAADSEAVKVRLAKMNDQSLEKFISAVESRSSPQASWDREPRKCFPIQRDLARAELAARAMR
jgi:hypothetical protein